MPLGGATCHLPIIIASFKKSLYTLKGYYCSVVTKLSILKQKQYFSILMMINYFTVKNIVTSYDRYLNFGKYAENSILFIIYFINFTSLFKMENLTWKTDQIFCIFPKTFM